RESERSSVGSAGRWAESGLGTFAQQTQSAESPLGTAARQTPLKLCLWIARERPTPRADRNWRSGWPTKFETCLRLSFRRRLPQRNPFQRSSSTSFSLYPIYAPGVKLDGWAVCAVPWDLHPAGTLTQAERASVPGLLKDTDERCARRRNVRRKGISRRRLNVRRIAIPRARRRDRGPGKSDRRGRCRQ